MQVEDETREVISLRHCQNYCKIASILASRLLSWVFLDCRKSSSSLSSPFSRWLVLGSFSCEESPSKKKSVNAETPEGRLCGRASLRTQPLMLALIPGGSEVGNLSANKCRRIFGCPCPQMPVSREVKCRSDKLRSIVFVLTFILNVLRRASVSKWICETCCPHPSAAAFQSWLNAFPRGNFIKIHTGRKFAFEPNGDFFTWKSVPRPRAAAPGRGGSSQAGCCGHGERSPWAGPPRWSGCSGCGSWTTGGSDPGTQS